MLFFLYASKAAIVSIIFKRFRHESLIFVISPWQQRTDLRKII